MNIHFYDYLDLQKNVHYINCLKHWLEILLLTAEF